MRLLRLFLFGLALSVPVLAWAAIYLPAWGGRSDISGEIVAAIVRASPIVSGDLTVLGEISPAILAALAMACAPDVKKPSVLVLVVLALLVGYVAVLHLTLFVQSDSATPILASVGIDDKGLGSLMQLVESMRTFCVVLAAAVFGLKVNKGG